MHTISKLANAALLMLAWMGCTPARADLTATFADPENHRSLTMEIADSDDIRITDEDGSYTLIKGNQAYRVSAGPGGPRAVSYDALAWLTAEGLRTGKVAVGTASNDPTGPAKPFRYEPREAVMIAGYSGIAYRIVGVSDGEPLVLTDDAELLPLGKAFARYIRLAAQASPFGDDSPVNEAELLAGKGVLANWGLRLRSVDRSPIAGSRFVLSVAPVTLADVKVPAEAPSSAKRPSSIVSARFFGDQLLTLDDSGAMQKWSEGSQLAMPFATPGKVGSFCITARETWLVTEREGREIEVWSGMPGSWRKAFKLAQSKQEYFQALDCGGAEPLLLTSRSIRFLRSGRSVTARQAKGSLGGYAVTLQHGGFLYVGINAGEWGGGLHRYPLSGGSGQLLDASDPQKLCGGTLNAACSPVTGLAPDPARPDCVLATTGLVHMMSQGSVVRVCKGEIELAYAKPYTLDPDWHFDPRRASQESQMSVPFYALGSNDNGTWAVGVDGIYRFAKNPLPSFVPFPKAAQRSAGAIDWSNADFVLIVTDMNQRHSLSGSSLILAPR